jgi:hypothetical protein
MARGLLTATVSNAAQQQRFLFSEPDCQFFLFGKA